MKVTSIRIAGVLLCTMVASWCITGIDADERAARARGEKQWYPKGLPHMHAYFYIMRQQGNPDVDVDARRVDAWRAMATSGRLDPQKAVVALGNDWNERGPWNIGGRIRALAIDPVNPSIIYAGAASGGVWKSTNLGSSWFPLGDDLPTLAIGALAIDRNNPNRIFAGVGEPLDQSGRINASFILSNSQGILKSEDAGATWTLIPWNASVVGVHRIALHPASADTMLVATRSGLYKTTDGGGTWSRTLTGVITDVEYRPGNPAIAYAGLGPNNGGSGNGVYISSAGGDRFSWVRSDLNFPAADSVGRIEMAVTPADPQRIYAAVALNQRRQSNRLRDFLLVMVSKNGGQSWERKINAVASNVTNGQSWYDLALEASPHNPDVVLIGGLHVHRSTNGGSGFAQITNGSNVHVDIHAFAFHPTETNSVFVGCDGGVYNSTTLGSNWFAKNSNLGTVQYYACTYDPSAPEKLFGGTQDNGSQGMLTQSNTAWSILFGGDGGNTAIDPKNSNVRFFTSASLDANGNIFRPIWRTGIGSNRRLDEGLNGGSSADRFTWVPALMFHPTDATRLFTATQYVYVMRNPGGNLPVWQVITPMDLGGGSGVVSDFDISTTDPTIMYAVTSNGRAHIARNLLSLDPEWQNVSAGLPNRWLADVTVDWDDPNTAYIAVSGYGSGHAYKTTNAGQTWQNISGDLPDIPANAIIRSRTDVNTIFLATDIGVWVTTNGGTNWRRFGIGMPNVVVYDMKLTPDNVLVAGTHGRGMWTSSAVLSSEQPGTRQPRSFTLGSNYPNPFNPSTNIPFSLDRSAHVRLDVYTPGGVRVATIVDEMRRPGSHTVTFDARTLPSGMYLSVLEVEGVTMARGMIVTK